MTKKKTTTDALEILHRRFVENDPEMQEALIEVRADHRIAKAIMELRGKLGLSQKQFAELVGTTAAVIRRLEDADYEGSSMSMLERIAAAVKHKLELDIRFVAAKKSRPFARNGAAKKRKGHAVA
jgi:ribosome-binding protein aMBF1 (putative translation factor)